MLFQAGDMFQMNGKTDYKVLFADENYFVCCPVIPATKERSAAIAVSSPEIYSNIGSLHEKYWIRKIDAYGGIYQGCREL